MQFSISASKPKHLYIIIWVEWVLPSEHLKFFSIDRTQQTHSDTPIHNKRSPFPQLSKNCLIDCRTIQCCPKMLMNRSHNCLAGARPGKINFTLVKFTRIQQLWLVRKDWFLDYSKENLQLGASLNKQGNLQQVFWDARGDKKRRGLLHWGE